MNNQILHATVDGQNPAPVDMVHIPLFIRWCRISSINNMFFGSCFTFRGGFITHFGVRSEQLESAKQQETHLNIFEPGD